MSESRRDYIGILATAVRTGGPGLEAGQMARYMAWREAHPGSRAVPRTSKEARFILTGTHSPRGGIVIPKRVR